MNKPKNYDTTEAFGTFTPLELGGHVCKIMKVEETKSRNGKEMIKISLDIAEGSQKGYYTNQYRNDNRTDKKWGCIVYQLTEDNDGNTNKGFKTFIDAVEKSNSNFKESEIWNERFSTYFKDKLVGGVFGREQYEAKDGSLKWSTKCVQFRPVSVIREGVEVPEDKYLNSSNAPKQANSAPKSNSDFEAIDDDDLPF